ncbi:Hemerythrin HHE cation binding domain-containing protein [Sphingomonas sp. NFR04]|uniref:hemerythrin domain-containing protein n=1 Tax=Sphingomonas sp. NFR04 TaxID=1566283 RepID=UPI0008E6C506|nr:hemerythrin domain-containing protein [Sphingomonas sp. NFR04]SFK57065.1 Hemerythrin HHE cation binding domain-containing protein [Sphingomonas sp. NFR04]
MSILDQAIAAITPPESEQDRREATAKAEALARPGDWLSQILGHHREIEAQFERLRTAAPSERMAEQKRLGLLLTAHSIAEEVSVYPALAADHQVGHAELAYQEQSAAKMEMGLLERLDPSSQDYHDKLEHIRGAVLHHIYSEEGTWYPKLIESAGPADQDRATSRYAEEYARYMGQDSQLFTR